MNHINLLGKKKEEVISFLKDKGINYSIIYTKAPRISYECSEERVLRVLKKKDQLEVLISFFRLPVNESI